MKRTIIKLCDILVIALFSTVSALLLFNINHLLNIIRPFNIYLAIIPVFFVLLIYNINKNHISSKSEIESKVRQVLKYIYFSLGFSSLLYLMFLFLDINIINYKLQVAICILLILTTVIRMYALFYNKTADVKNKIDHTVMEKKSLFSIYYINISKVFEIAMLLNNKVMTSIAKEKMHESLFSSDEQLSIDINLKYLEEIMQGLSYNKRFQKTNSEKNRVLENFDVKTTKSNLLEVIIRKAKEHKNDCDLKQGDLVIFKDVQLKLINQKETMNVMKILLNGAFNGTVISGESNDMQIELNMASLINSVLKDCVYELSCHMGEDSFLITIPMTFDNDFENSYSIYDLLIGKVTVIGIFKGIETGETNRSIFELFNPNSIAKTSLPNIGYNENGDYSLTPSSKEISRSTITSMSDPVPVQSGLTPSKQTSSLRKHVDVIAIIQEINPLE